MIVGTDLLQTDQLAYEVLYELKKKFQCLGDFTEDPYEMKQLRYARDFLFQYGDGLTGDQR